MPYEAIEGIFIRPLVRAAIRSHKLATGRYDFAFIKDGSVIEQGRCHVFIGEDGISLVDPRSDEVAVVPLDDVQSVELPKTTFRRPVLSVSLKTGGTLQLSDTMKGQQADRLTDSLRQVIPGARPLTGLRFFGGYVESARFRRDDQQERIEAGKRGELLPRDARTALKEPVGAQDNCVFLGSVVPPERPTGPAYFGWALAGETTIGFINPKRSTTMFMQSARYEDVTAVAHRAMEGDIGETSHLYELVTNRGPQPYMKRDGGDFVEHFAFRLPPPCSDGVPNVAALMLQRISRQSKFEVQFGSEEEVEGLLLLPMTPRGPEDTAPIASATSSPPPVQTNWQDLAPALMGGLISSARLLDDFRNWQYDGSLPEDVNHQSLQRLHQQFVENDEQVRSLFNKWLDIPHPEVGIQHDSRQWAVLNSGIRVMLTTLDYEFSCYVLQRLGDKDELQIGEDASGRGVDLFDEVAVVTGQAANGQVDDPDTVMQWVVNRRESEKPLLEFVQCHAQRVGILRAQADL